MQTYNGTCHCGAVEFQITTDLATLGRCNCSFCKRRGAVMHIMDAENLVLRAGEDNLTLYQFHTNTAKHYFCKTCGGYTHHYPRTRPGMVGVNIGCLEGVEPYPTEINSFTGADLP